MIECVDSTGPAAGWTRMSDWQKSDAVATIQSAGFLIHNGEQCKRVCGTWHKEPDLNIVKSATGVITIPTCCIVRMVDLAKVPPLIPEIS